MTNKKNEYLQIGDLVKKGDIVSHQFMPRIPMFVIDTDREKKVAYVGPTVHSYWDFIKKTKGKRFLMLSQKELIVTTVADDGENNKVYECLVFPAKEGRPIYTNSKLLACFISFFRSFFMQKAA